MTNSETRWVRLVNLTAPSLSDNVADADRLLLALRRDFGVSEVLIDLDVLRTIPRLLREWGYRARCVCFPDGRGDRLRLVGLGPPDAELRLIGVAIDLGTTRIALRCLDLESGVSVAEGGFDNPQITIAPDVLARIHHADQSGGLEELQRLVIDGLNSALDDLCKKAGLSRDQVCLISVAGNTTMSHLFLGLEPRWIIREPYIPAANTFALVRAKELGIQASIGARVFVFPNIGSYFGGDLIAGILEAGLHERDEPALMVDVGTNAEVVLGNKEWLLACAGAAGPALEGGAASMGMMAEPGVIDAVELDGESGELRLHTIADKPPRGICGSGLIDLTACLFMKGIIDIRGEFVPSACGSRLIDLDGSAAYVVLPRSESAQGKDLCISQPELDSLIRSKAAMFTILETISAAVGLTPTDFSTFFVAGTFGSYIDPRSAITIGMIPDLPLESFHRLGNSSLGGATRVLTSVKDTNQIASIRDAITYLELNVNQDFMIRFSAAKFLPHTDAARFPSVPIPPQNAN